MDDRRMRDAQRRMKAKEAKDGLVKHMSDERIDELLKICEAASPGPGAVGPLTEDDGSVPTNEELAQHFKRYIDNGDGDRCYAVIQETQDETFVVGIFGNGPMSHGNARLWGVARDEFPAALRLIKKLQADVDALQASAEKWKAGAEAAQEESIKLLALVKEQKALLSTYDNVDADLNALHDQIAELNQERDKALNERDVAVDLLNQDDTVLRLYGLLSCTAKRYECEAQVQADNLGIVKARLDESEAGVDDLVSTADVLRDKVERLQIAVQKLAVKSTMFADLAVDKGIFSSHDRAEEISEINNVLAVAGEAEDTNA